jgi:hypothetical protein
MNRHSTLCLLVVLLTLSACSSSDDTDPGPPVPTPTPLMVDDLTAIAGGKTSVMLAWTSPGFPDKIAIRYDLRYIAQGSENADWDSWTVATPPPPDTESGQARTHEVTGFEPSQAFAFAMKASTDGTDWSELSNVASARTIEMGAIYVNVDGSGDYPTIEAAIDSAKVGDLILVGPGRYTWDNQGTGDALHGLIHVQRDYTDFEVRSIAGPEATILDSQLHGKVMSVTGGSFGEPGNLDYAGITIDGFTFTNGRANAAEPNPDEGWSGGGLNLHLTDTVVRNCIFTENEANDGGGLWCGGQGDALIENCLFENNRGKLGGGIMLINSDPRITVRDCTIRGNHSTFAGGGIFAINVTATLENLLIVGNDSTDKGGGISVSGLHPDCQVIRCTVADNKAALGSAIRLTGNTILRIESSLLAFNTGSAAFSAAVQSGVEIGCTLIFGHDMGNQLPVINTDLGGNLETDPLFCDRVGYLLEGNSPCTPGHHPGGNDCGLIGARGDGCGG